MRYAMTALFFLVAAPALAGTFPWEGKWSREGSKKCDIVLSQGSFDLGHGAFPVRNATEKTVTFSRDGFTEANRADLGDLDVISVEAWRDDETGTMTAEVTIPNSSTDFMLTPCH